MLNMLIRKTNLAKYTKYYKSTATIISRKTMVYNPTYYSTSKVLDNNSDNKNSNSNKQDIIEYLMKKGYNNEIIDGLFNAFKLSNQSISLSNIKSLGRYYI